MASSDSVSSRRAAELIEVVTLPAHRDLDHAVQFTEHEGGRYQHAPPDHWTDAEQPYFDLHDRVGVRRERAIFFW
jgi:hypothetical protein